MVRSKYRGKNLHRVCIGSAQGRHRVHRVCTGSCASAQDVRRMCAGCAQGVHRQKNALCGLPWARPFLIHVGKKSYRGYFWPLKWFPYHYGDLPMDLGLLFKMPHKVYLVCSSLCGTPHLELNAILKFGRFNAFWRTGTGADHPTNSASMTWALSIFRQVRHSRIGQIHVTAKKNEESRFFISLHYSFGKQMLEAFLKIFQHRKSYFDVFDV